MGYSPTLCFACAILKKRENKQKRSKKVEKCSSLCRDINFVCRDTKFKQTKGTLSYLATKCRNKGSDRAQWHKRNLCCNKEFLCHDITEERCEENCRDNPLLCRDIKGLRLTD